MRGQRGRESGREKILEGLCRRGRYRRERERSTILLLPLPLLVCQ